jgi:spermidine synthase
VFGWTYITAIVVLPVAFVSGIQFPLLIALLGQGRPAISRQLGITYAWNTLGAIAGSLIGGFGGMPLLTAPGMWLGISFLLAAVSLAVLLLEQQRTRFAVGVVVGLVVMTACSLFARGPSATWRHSSIGAGRSNIPHRSRANDLQRWINETRHFTVWEADGVESSVGILCLDGYSFIVNGKNDGNALSDSPTQVGMSVIGAVLHKNPKSALVIGLGTGETAGWLAKLRDIEHVDVVELEPAIDEMALRCSDLNWDVLHNRNVRRIYNDGREFVFTTNNKYDLIISEPSNPYRAGIASLYTTEFYEAVKKRLNPDGIFLQWLQAYETSDSTVGTVVSTIGSEFAHVEMWRTMPLDLLLVCSESPITYSTAELKERISSERVRDALMKCWYVDDVEGFLSQLVAGPQWAKELAGSRTFPRNTDDRTVVEYGFAKTLGRTDHFAPDVVRKQLNDRGVLLPQIPGEPIDWHRVELRRQIYNALLGNDVSLAMLPDRADQDLVGAVVDCIADHYPAALKRWPAEYRKPDDLILQALLAKCYAVEAQPEFTELAERAKGKLPAEIAASRVFYHANRQEWPAASQALDEMLGHLHKNPWVLPMLVDEAIRLSAVVARNQPANATRIYEQLSQPFAAHRSEFRRQVFRFFAGSEISPERAVEALADLEPDFVWIAEALELRAKSYAAVKHPMAFQAQQDWQKWMRQKALGQ